MRIEVDPPVSGAEHAVVEVALARAGVLLPERPAGYLSRWRRTAAREAVENEPARASYALSPRSTRGATRA
jgi:hypothetical protein